MFLQPKKVKYKKIKKGKLVKFSYNNNLNFGTLGLKALESGFISARQLESARQAMARKIKKKGKLWIKIYPNLPITKKPTEVRMGKGKGNVSHWVAKIKGGSVLFEVCGINRKTAIKAFRTGGAKLPIRTQIFD
jgi:large subunit ribosomal protein L16